MRQRIRHINTINFSKMYKSNVSGKQLVPTRIILGIIRVLRPDVGY